MRTFRITIPALLILVAGCGEESSSTSSSSSFTSSPGFSEPPETENVALAANGGSATASYDSGNAGIVINGNTDAGEFWAGNSRGDYVTVAFDDIYLVHEFTVYTNNTSTSTVVEISENGTDFEEFVYFSECRHMSMGSGRISCIPNEEISASHFRVVMDAHMNISSRQIYEIEVEGYQE